MTPPEHEVRYLEMPDIRAAGTLPDGFDLVGHLELLGADRRGLRAGRRFRAAGVPVVLGGPHVSGAAAGGARARRCRRGRRGRAALAAGPADAAAGGSSRRYALARRRLRPRRRAAARLRTARHRPLQPPDRPDQPRLPAPLRVLRRLRPLCRRYKQKPAAKVLAELDRILELWKHPFIEFADDNSFVEPRLLAGTAPRDRQAAIRWFAETDISVGEDEELLDLLRKSGCAEVLIGLESPVARRPGRHREPRQLEDAAAARATARRSATIQSHGITVNGCFVLGLDGHGPAIFDQVRDFVRAADLFDVQITLMTPFPGTPLLRAAPGRGPAARADGDWGRARSSTSTSPRRHDAEQLAAGFRALGVDLYSDEFTSGAATVQRAPAVRDHRKRSTA